MAARGLNVSETELELLKVLWSEGPGSVRQFNDVLHKQGRRWAYTTVQTMLGRLCTKGFVESDKTAAPHCYRALVSRDDLLKVRLDDLADELCEGTATPLVLALVEGHRFSADELRQFRRLLKRLEKEK